MHSCSSGHLSTSKSSCSSTSLSRRNSTRVDFVRSVMLLLTFQFLANRHSTHRIIKNFVLHNVVALTFDHDFITGIESRNFVGARVVCICTFEDGSHQLHEPIFQLIDVFFNELVKCVLQNSMNFRGMFSNG